MTTCDVNRPLINYLKSISIEFTDYFGRTRKVEKSEYEKIKEHTDVIVTKKPSEEEPENTEFLRQKEEWRKQEELNKERNDVYYQDILFDGE